MSVERLTDAEIQASLPELKTWQYENNALIKTYEMDDFLRAIQFVNAIAHLAERQQHHPDIDIRYTNVKLSYWTHTAKGVTVKDFSGAKEADEVAKPFLKPIPSL